MFDIQGLHRMMRDIPKPVIAAVNGVAVGGGHVLHVICDLSIASETARFGQAGPRVGSFDAGFGSTYLARVVGEKRARQIWFLLDLYDAHTAERWNLVNDVVPPDQLMDKAREYARKIASYSPTALQLPQALVQRRHRAHHRDRQRRLRRPRLLREVGGGHGGGDRLRREAQARLLALPLRRDGLPRAGEGRRGATTGRHRAE